MSREAFLSELGEFAVWQEPYQGKDPISAA